MIINHLNNNNNNNNKAIKLDYIMFLFVHVLLRLIKLVWA